MSAEAKGAAAIGAITGGLYYAGTYLLLGQQMPLAEAAAVGIAAPAATYVLGKANVSTDPNVSVAIIAAAPAAVSYSIYGRSAPKAAIAAVSGAVGVAGGVLVAFNGGKGIGGW